jgi:hypothetical protein
MTDEQPARDHAEEEARHVVPDPSAEAKRLEARRRFLRGGAALAALVTVCPGRAGAVTVSECAEAFPQFSVFIVNFNRSRGNSGSDQAALNCLGLVD